MKKIGTSILAFLFSFVLFANGPSIIKETLTWSQETLLVPAEDADTYHISHFEGALYDESHPTLPYYSNRFLLSTYSEVQRVVIHALPAAVLVYPNPVGSDHQLTFRSQVPGPWAFVLYDATGREVAQGNFEGMYTLETHKFSEGVYFYQVLNEEKMVRGRVVIKN